MIVCQGQFLPEYLVAVLHEYGGCWLFSISLLYMYASFVPNPGAKISNECKFHFESGYHGGTIFVPN